MNSNGFSLIEVLVSSAIGGAVALGMATIINWQQTEFKSINQKAENLELKSQINAVIASSSICTWQFRDKLIDVTVPPTSGAPSPSVVTVPELRSGALPTSDIVVQLGPLPRGQYGLRVDAIRLKDFYAAGPPNEYIATLEITNEPASMVRAIRPIQLQVLIGVVATDPPGAKRIERCGGLSASGGPVSAMAGWCEHNSGATQCNPNALPPATCGAAGVGCTCPAGYQLRMTGGCNAGACIDPAVTVWNTAATPVYYFTCMSL